ncbi:hypothetical protein NMU03_08815 [Allocoprobacillus halotolerans]|uniref:DUF5668 domain-containing protein n=1 Tax=Allocoprobacillus halotolerans TaxID=2944914 RepID=A0ABY5I074_9FIRM|nr:hypothetical protein [Allocoprobacillus halotolerans]UTY37829.1 hypothetical protein NMU03_08815 [Allocoprobacillus halotolerans]
MNLRKNIGIIMMMLGVILTINHDQQNELVKQLETSIKAYWPLFISFIGIYMISTPRKRK